MFVGLILVLWAFDASLSSPEGFASAREALTDNVLTQLIAWGLLSALSYHFVAGVRHLIMDMGYGETLQGGQRGAQLTVIITAVLVVLSGVWVW